MPAMHVQPSSTSILEVENFELWRENNDLEQIFIFLKKLFNRITSDCHGRLLNILHALTTT